MSAAPASPDPGTPAPGPRAPSLLDALAPVVVLIGLLVLTIVLFGTAVFSGVLASFTQPEVVKAFVGKPGQGPVLNGIEAIYKSMATGHVAHSSNETINALFSRGGMTSMLTTVWLILGALGYAAIMERAGFIDRLIQPLVTRTRTDGRLIAATGLTCIGLNIIAGDQYVADVLPSRAFRAEYARRGLAPRMLSRTVEDTGTVTSPLVPWNSCGAYMAGVLQVPTVDYLPYAFFNLINPLLSILFGLTGFRVERQEPATPQGQEPASPPGGSGQPDSGPGPTPAGTAPE